MNRRSFMKAAGAVGVAGVMPQRIICAATGAQPVSSTSAGTAARGLRGEYGFITSKSLGPQPDEQIRARVATMAQRYGIREFQFYDWFADYSNPVMGDQWVDGYFRKIPITRRSIEIAIDEIHRQSGRAWAYVQAVGSEEQHLDKINGTIRKMIRADGKWHWHPGGIPNPRFPTYLPNAAWAKHMTLRWGPAIKQLGFDGIHWDTLGKQYRNYDEETAGVQEFLRTAGPLLQAHGLAQTLNFVNLAWWDPETIRTCVEFPYAETWSGKTANVLYAEMDKIGCRGVFPMYPTVDVPSGWTETQVIRVRREMAAKHSMVYLVVGDGARRMRGVYWPDTVPLSPEEDAIMRGMAP